ncbi:MAG: calcium-binding protein [Solirubrobacteraceae bacterium]
MDSSTPRGDRRAGARTLSAVLAGVGLLALLPATSGAKVIVGGAGADHLTGSDPSGDLIVGGGGSDTLTGGPGNDRIYGVRSGNTINGGGGDNYVEGGTGDDKITVGNGNNTIYSGSGHDSITAGDDNNYVDPGGAPDKVSLGNGNNVVNGGSGGMDLEAGNGNNTVYLLSGQDTVHLGSGVNHVYAATTGLASLDCGGNPQSTFSVNASADKTGRWLAFALRTGKIKNCAITNTFVGPKATISKSAGIWQVFHLQGGDGPDKLFGGHGGGTIDGGGGDNVLWADYRHDTGGARAKSKTTRINADNGDNIVYGGRGTNIIHLGNGHNFVRGGAWNNDITVGSGFNAIRLQGKGHNTVHIGGGSAFVESYANNKSVKAQITCENGAKGTVIYGVVKPKSNCPIQVKANSPQGKLLQISGIVSIPQSDPVVTDPLQPGVGAGVPRPPLTPSGV